MKPVERLNAIIERASNGDVAVLSTGERMLFLVNAFLFEFESGGLSGFLYNSYKSRQEPNPSWATAADTSAAIAALGEPELARTLEKAIALVSSAVATDDETWQDFTARADPAGQLSGLESDISAAVEALWDRLYAAAAETAV